MCELYSVTLAFLEIAPQPDYNAPKRDELEARRCRGVFARLFQSPCANSCRALVAEEEEVA